MGTPQIGTRVGPYQIDALIGEGGMGTVFRALDTRLGRTVALKFLKGNLSEGLDGEARAIAALNHPHICALFDVGKHDNTPYLVMEYLEGSRLRGPIPVRQVLRYSAQIADALDAAHKRGIIHRDLKPDNVLLTRRSVKVLDFGIATFNEPVKAIADPAVTRTIAGTATPTIAGTPQYMAPEQIQGGPLDARTDIFALGCILYELITGQKAFRGDTSTAVSRAILATEPLPLSGVVADLPVDVERVVMKCLKKDAEERWQTARDLKDELEWLTNAPNKEPSRKPARLLASGMLAAVAVLGGSAYIWNARARVDDNTGVPYRFSVYPPHGAQFTGSGATVPTPEFAISPDGRYLAYVATRPEKPPTLWLRSLDELTATSIPNTEDASQPFWSPDSKKIAFFSQGKLKAIQVGGGPALVICDAGTDFRSGTWSGRGEILFSLSNNVIFRVSESGGTPTPATRIDNARGEAVHRWPHLLPDDTHFLYFVRGAKADWRGVFAGSLDEPNSKTMVAALSHSAVYRNGYLFYIENGNLFARPFDVKHLKPAGSPALVAEGVHGSTNTWAAISVSRNGVLAYASAAIRPGRPTWYDRSGQLLSTLDPVADYVDVRLSPDGKLVALTRQDANVPAPDIWVHDFERGTVSRVTTAPTLDSSPIWSADSSSIYFRSNRTGFAQIYRVPLTDPSTPSVVFSQQATTREYSNAVPGDVSNDGRWLVYTSAAESGSFDIWKVDMQNPASRSSYQSLPTNEIDPILSPDGKLLAYASDETGHYEVYVQSFPTPGKRWQISNRGGTEPRWRADGGEIYYLSTDKKIMSASVQLSPQVRVSTPIALFGVSTPASSAYRRSYDVTADGKRFLVSTLVADTPAPALDVLVNWPELVRK